MSYKVAKTIISEIERVVVHEQSAVFKFLDRLKREVIYPLKLLSRGCGIWYRDFAKFSLLSLLAIIFIAWLSVELSKSGGSFLVQFIFPLAILVPMILSIFSVPTSYSFCGIRHEYIDLVVQILRNNEVTNIEQLNPIKNNIEAFDNRVKTRIIGLRMFMVLCWSGFLYMYSEFTKVLIENKNVPTVDDVMPLSLMLLAVILLYIAIESYSKANILIFRSAQIGCNEFEFIIANSAEGPNKEQLRTVNKSGQKDGYIY